MSSTCANTNNISSDYCRTSFAGRTRTTEYFIPVPYKIIFEKKNNNNNAFHLYVDYGTIRSIYNNKYDNIIVNVAFELIQ